MIIKCKKKALKIAVFLTLKIILKYVGVFFFWSSPTLLTLFLWESPIGFIGSIFLVVFTVILRATYFDLTTEGMTK